MNVAENHLIELLPQKDKEKLLAGGDLVEFSFPAVLCEAESITEDVYFPVDGFISLVTMLDGTHGLEIGMVGREGMIGVQVALGVNQLPLRALVQGPGSAWRFNTRQFGTSLKSMPALQQILNRYIYVRMVQLGSASACLRYHQIDQRMARWLLTCQDRVRADHFHITHEFLACMLGVRRVSITTAAGELQRGGLISYHRGDLTVLDRVGLEAVACSCYKSDQHTYHKMLR